jgi:glycerate kinase
MKIAVAMDSYKGCMSAIKCCDIINNALTDAMKECLVYKYPMADGGEGTVDCLVFATKGRKEYVTVKGVFGNEMTGYFGILGDNETCVIESACASGIQGISKNQLNPMRASSYGTGQLIRAALEGGYRKIIVGFGGTATSDGGMGALAALGMVFYDKDMNVLNPCGAAMVNVDSIDSRGVIKELENAYIEFACDVENVYYGKEGAAYVFSPQKGATPSQVVELDAGLVNLTRVFKEQLDKDISDIPSSGAAGGLVGGLMTVCKPVIKSGFDVVLNYTDLEDTIKNCDIVITGEGRTDAQTRYGKLPMRVGILSKKYSKPVICISGAVTKDAEVLKNYGITSLFSINRGPITLEESMSDSENLLYLQTFNIAGLLSIL